jgi:peptide/nickel transport system permease protein
MSWSLDLDLQPQFPPSVRPRSPWLIALYQLRRNKGAMVGLVAFVLVALSGIFAPQLAPYDPVLISPDDYLQPPSPAHWFGTDSYGRDVLSRTLYGGRISLKVGLGSVIIAAILGVLLGLTAGYFGGWVDGAIMRFIDMLLAFPGLLLALGVVALLGPGMDNVIVAVGISGIPGYARVVRGCVLSAREEVYVEAARSVGCRDGHIVVRHLLPNILGPVIVLSTLDIAWAILTASSLSFLGLGAQPPTPEWGAMLSEGRGVLREAPWQTAFPGLMVMTTVLSINLFGDGLRDALDPRMYQ